MYLSEVGRPSHSCGGGGCHLTAASFTMESPLSAHATQSTLHAKATMARRWRRALPSDLSMARDIYARRHARPGIAPWPARHIARHIESDGRQLRPGKARSAGWGYVAAKQIEVRGAYRRQRRPKLSHNLPPWLCGRNFNGLPVEHIATAIENRSRLHTGRWRKRVNKVHRVHPPPHDKRESIVDGVG